MRGHCSLSPPCGLAQIREKEYGTVERRIASREAMLDLSQGFLRGWIGFEQFVIGPLTT